MQLDTLVSMFVGGSDVLFYLHIGGGKAVLSAVHKMLPFFGRLNTFNLLWCYPRNINANKGGLESPVREVIA